MLAALTLGGCSVRKMAVHKLADALTSGSAGWASDDDPQLVGDAFPFALKTLEGLLAEDPDQPRLLLATCRGFVSYATGWVAPEAEREEAEGEETAGAARQRTVRLDLRARGYCLQALEDRFPGMAKRLELKPGEALAAARKSDVELLYWTAAAWGSAIAEAPSRPDLIADLPAVRALFERARELDPSWHEGALAEAMIPLAALSPMLGGSPERARELYDEAVRISSGRRASPHVTWARSAAVATQDRKGFREALGKALAVDPEAAPEDRLENYLAQREGRWLLAHTDDLFFAGEGDPGGDGG